MTAASAIAAVASLLLAMAILHYGHGHPGYSPVRHTISELGEVGAANGPRVSLGVFLPFGLAMLAVSGLALGGAPGAAMLAACLAAGYLGAAFFPCDPGSPLVGSWRQSVHNAAGAVQYVGGTFAIWRMAPLHEAFAGFALLVGAAVVLMSIPAAFAWRGLVQRVAEVSLLVSLVLALGPAAATR